MLPSGLIDHVEKSKRAIMQRPLAEEAASRGVKAREVQRERFAMLLSYGVSVEEASNTVDISPATGYRWVKDDDIKGFVAEFRKEVRETLVRKLMRAGNDAIDNLIYLMTDETAGGPTRLNATIALLDRIGLKPSEIIKHVGDAAEPIVIVEYAGLDNDAARKQQDRALGRVEVTEVEAEYEIIEP